MKRSARVYRQVGARRGNVRKSPLPTLAELVLQLDMRLHRQHRGINDRNFDDAPLSLVCRLAARLQVEGHCVTGVKLVHSRPIAFTLGIHFR
jgi:hypothetical protein